MQQAVSFQTHIAAATVHEPVWVCNGFQCPSNIPRLRDVDRRLARCKRATHRPICSDDEEMSWHSKVRIKIPRHGDLEEDNRRFNYNYLEEMDCSGHDISKDAHLLERCERSSVEGSNPSFGSADQSGKESVLQDNTRDQHMELQGNNFENSHLVDRQECLRCLTGEGGHFSHMSAVQVAYKVRSDRMGCVYPS